MNFLHQATAAAIHFADKHNVTHWVDSDGDITFTASPAGALGILRIHLVRTTASVHPYHMPRAIDTDGPMPQHNPATARLKATIWLCAADFVDHMNYVVNTAKSQGDNW